jgi:hypothetical protein
MQANSNGDAAHRWCCFSRMQCSCTRRAKSVKPCSFLGLVLGCRFCSLVVVLQTKSCLSRGAIPRPPALAFASGLAFYVSRGGAKSLARALSGPGTPDAKVKGGPRDGSSRPPRESESVGRLGRSSWGGPPPSR